MNQAKIRIPPRHLLRVLGGRRGLRSCEINLASFLRDAALSLSAERPGLGEGMGLLGTSLLGASFLVPRLPRLLQGGGVMIHDGWKWMRRACLCCRAISRGLGCLTNGRWHVSSALSTSRRAQHGASVGVLDEPFGWDRGRWLPWLPVWSCWASKINGADCLGVLRANAGGSVGKAGSGRKPRSTMKPIYQAQLLREGMEGGRGGGVQRTPETGAGRASPSHLARLLTQKTPTPPFHALGSSTQTTPGHATGQRCLTRRGYLSPAIGP